MFRHGFTVFEGHAGLLYHAGRLVETLGPGRHVRWGLHYVLTPVDLRLQAMVVQGQEVLTADGAPVRVAVVAWAAVADPALNQAQSDSYETQLYQIVQVLCRQAISSRTLDEVMADREALGGEIKSALVGFGEKFGIRIDELFVRDLTLGGGVKTAYTNALKAQLEARAMLEKARAETAALRNLANAAKMLQDNPGLLQLRAIQAVSESGGTLVLGQNGILPIVPQA
jgi:regulator of protease activity HflC (stomatin/prohibitin superfamily)